MTSLRFFIVTTLGFGLVACPNSDYRVKDSVRVINGCDPAFIVDYNSIVEAAKQVKDSGATNRKATESELDIVCEEFYSQYSLRLECIAKRDGENVIAKAKDHDQLCQQIETINSDSELPQKLNP